MGCLFSKKSIGPYISFALARTKQGSPGAYDRSFRWKYHQFRFLCHVSSGLAASVGVGLVIAVGLVSRPTVLGGALGRSKMLAPL